MRPRSVRTAADALCEVWFTVMALAWISKMIAPSARRKAAGYGQGQPTSALLAIYAFRRVMRDCGRYLPDMAEARNVLKGLCQRYRIRWGEEAFVPARKQPFTTAHLLAIAELLSSATTLLTWTQTLRRAVLTAFCHAISTGVRKDEWTASFVGDTCVRRANFTWVDAGGNDLPDTPEVNASRKNGDLLRGRSAKSKCDQLNIEWGARDMWFRLDDSNPINFAWRWQQWEDAHPCPPTLRHEWPAFSPTGDATPFTGSRAEACLRTILPFVMSTAAAAQRTWHSARITLATRLYARRGARGGIERDEVEGVTQALVRWKTVEAMRIYARMAPDQYADYVDMATDVTTDTDGRIPEGLPEVDPQQVLAEDEAAVAEFDGEIAKARQRGGASADGAASKRGKR
jgi:hypothetical protein